MKGLHRALLLPAAALLAGAQEPPAPAPEADIIDFRNDGAGRMTVPVTVNGSGPYPFLVDTGAERTVISRELAGVLKLAAGPRTILHSMTEVGPVQTAMIDELKVSRNAVKEVAAVALDESHLGADGMLGTDSLQSHRVVFDFHENVMKVVPSSERRASWEHDTIVVTARRRNGRLILTDAMVNGYKVAVIVDTGSTATVGNPALRDKLFGKKETGFQPVELTSVTGGRETVPARQVRRIKLGHVTINSLSVAFGDLQPFRKLGYADRPALLLGMDAFRLFGRVSIDFGKREIRLLKPGAARPSETNNQRYAGQSRPAG